MRPEDYRDESIEDHRRKIVRIIVERLSGEYGTPAWKPSNKPVDELVGTILSQNTSDINTARAFDALRAHFPTWEGVRDAPVEEIVRTIRSGGLANRKAPRIQQVLREILREDGTNHNKRISEKIRGLGKTGAMEWLISHDGVGPKTAACVLMFGSGLPALPVDTHVFRVAQRIGLISPQTSAVRAHKELEAIVDDASVYAFHMLLIRHGRRICQARNPKCETCILSDLCQYRQEQSTAPSIA